MTSPKSLQNNFGYAYKTGLRDNALIAGLNAVFLSLFFVLTPILYFFVNTTRYDQNDKLIPVNYKEEFSFMFSDGMGMYRYFVIAVLIATGILMGVGIFRFITGKKTINVYYSLGIKRTKLFAAKYLSGLTLIAASVVLPMLISLIANIIRLGANRFMIPAFFYLTLGMVSLTVFSYTLTAFVCTLVGTTFEGCLFSCILIVFPEIFFTCLQRFIESLVFGSAYGHAFVSEFSAEGLSQKFSNFNPLRYLSEGLYTFATAKPNGSHKGYDTGVEEVWHNPNFLPVIIWLLVSVIVFAFAMFFYERRKAEIGGFIGKNKPLNFIGVFLVGIFGFTFVFDMLEKKNMAVAIAVGALVFAVIYVILNIILLRNMKLFVKNLYTLPIQLAIVALIFVFFATGYFGNSNKIPETSEIASAKITQVYSSYAQISNDDYRYYFYEMTSPSGLPSGLYESENDIEFVRSINKQIIDAGKQKPHLMDDEYSGVAPYEIRILYTLKDGSTVKRRYYGITEDILKQMQKEAETDYYKSVLKKMFKDENKKVEQPKTYENGVYYGNSSEAYKEYNMYKYIETLRKTEDIRLYNQTFLTETALTFTPEQRQKLLDCIYSDLSNMSSGALYEPKDTLGMIAFMSVESSENNGVYGGAVMTDGGYYYETSDQAVYAESDGEFAGVSISSMSTVPKFYITPDMTNTVQFLKDTGYYNAMVAETKIRAVRIVKFSQISGLQDYYQTNLVENSEETLPYEFSAESRKDSFSMYSGESDWNEKSTSKDVYQSTDAALIKTLADVGKLRGVLSPDGYFVFFCGEKGLYSRLYVDAENMPADVKSEVEKNQLDVAYERSVY